MDDNIITVTDCSEIDWEEIPTGTQFVGIFKRSDCIGKIYNDKEALYICQNKKNGAPSPNNLGYKYSWVVYTSSMKKIYYFEEVFQKLTLIKPFEHGK